MCSCGGVCNASSDEIIAASNAGHLDPCDAEGTYVDRPADLTGEDLSRAFAGRDPVVTARHQVHVEFNSRGTSQFRDLTEALFEMGPKGRIAMFLDDELISAPTVTTPIRDGRGVITGGFTRESARALAIQLESGRLPIPLALIRESTVDALLGSDSLRKSLTAGLVGLGLVLLFIVIYYRMAGVVAGGRSSDLRCHRIGDTQAASRHYHHPFRHSRTGPYLWDWLWMPTF